MCGYLKTLDVRAAPDFQGRAGVLLALLILWPHSPADAAAGYALKAAMIYKIAKFVHWPDGSLDGTVKLCVIGNDEFGAELDDLAGYRLQRHPISIVRLASADQTALHCHVAFISRSERDDLGAILAWLAPVAVLTVSDIAGFAALGGMVELSTVDDRIGLQVNPEAGRRVGLEIGAQVLQRATLVADGEAGGVKP